MSDSRQCDERFQLNTLPLLVVIIALGFALAVRHHQVAQLQVELEKKEADLNMARAYVHSMNNRQAGRIQNDVGIEQGK